MGGASKGSLNVRGLNIREIRRILARLNEAGKVQDMGLPGLKLHLLKGDRAGTWSVWVSGHWRMTFRFEAGNAYDVDLVDYHYGEKICV